MYSTKFPIFTRLYMSVLGCVNPIPFVGRLAIPRAPCSLNKKNLFIILCDVFRLFCRLANYDRFDSRTPSRTAFFIHGLLFSSHVCLHQEHYDVLFQRTLTFSEDYRCFNQRYFYETESKLLGIEILKRGLTLNGQKRLRKIVFENLSFSAVNFSVP